MNPTHVLKPTRTNKIARRLLYFTGLGFFSAACILPAVVPKVLQQTRTPTPIDYCATIGPAPRFEFTFDQIEPAVAGGEVVVTGLGRYIDPCTGTVVNFTLDTHSSLYFDGLPAGDLTCQDDACEGRLTVPEGAKPGVHTLSTDVGSSYAIDITILEATGPSLAPDPSPVVSGCPDGQTAEMIWPQLSESQPAQAAPGAAVKIMGSGGYVRCGEAGYNESARSFQLFFDKVPVEQISCYVNHCQAVLSVPPGTAEGMHIISVEGGYELYVEIVQP